MSSHRIRSVLLAASMLLVGLSAGVLVGRQALPIAPEADADVAEKSATAGESSPGKTLWTCGMHPQVIQDRRGICPICHMKLQPMRSSEHEPVEHEAAAGPAVTIDPVIVQNMGVRVAAVEEGPLRTTVRTVGFVRAVEGRQHEVTLKMSGYVERLFADTEGMLVEKGDPLFELYSPEILVAQQELIGARSALERLGARATPDVRGEAESLVETARRKLLLWDLTPEEVDEISRATQASGRVTFRSRWSGYVMDKRVVPGSSVMAGQVLLRIDDHDVLWIDAAVYEPDYAWVRAAQAVRVRVDAAPGESFAGSIIWRSPEIDAKTRSGAVRIAVENPEHRIHPGMFATAEIPVDLADRAILVPREAILDTGARQVAFVARGGGRFEPRNVRVGVAGSDGRVQVLEGLAPGDTVVVSGQFLLDTESRLLESQRRFTEEGLTTPPAPGHVGH
jgi:Cu(I)/Ag(I) efflux system membrane fusion protein